MKKNRILILWIWPVIGLGVNGVSSATDSRVHGYVPKSEYEKLKREVETLKSQMQRLLETAAATPESKPSATEAKAAEAKREKKPVASVPPPSKESVGRSDPEEFEVAKGDRRKEAEEAKRELDQFLRAQKLIFKPGEVQLEFGAFYAHEAETNQVSPVLPVFNTRFAGANFRMRYGLAENLEFNFSVPMGYTEQETDIRPLGPSFTRKTGVGFGDINWAFRYAAIREEGAIPEVTLNVNAKSDTGDADRGLGSGFWNVGTGVSLVKTIDPVVFFGSLGYTWTLKQRDVDPGDQIPYSIGMGFSLNDRVSLSMAMAGSAIRHTELTKINGNEIGGAGFGGAGSGLDINSFQFTATVQLAKRMYLEPFVGFGLTDEAPDFLVGINVPVGLEGRFPLPFSSH